MTHLTFLILFLMHVLLLGLTVHAAYSKAIGLRRRARKTVANDSIVYAESTLMSFVSTFAILAALFAAIVDVAPDEIYGISIIDWKVPFIIIDTSLLFFIIVVSNLYRQKISRIIQKLRTGKV